MWGEPGVLSGLVFVEVTTPGDLFEPVARRLRGVAGVEVSIFSSG